LIEDRRWRGVPLVLLHAAYPFTREAGYLAAMYPQVYLDLGEAIPQLSIQGMRWAVRAALELTPTSKLLCSTDGHSLPETYYLAGRWLRRALAAELERAVGDGDLTRAEAETAAGAMLHANATRLYRLI
jgi:predicted TIM-barrel fold metal-dependent hydrolase